MKRTRILETTARQLFIVTEQLPIAHAVFLMTGIALVLGVPPLKREAVATVLEGVDYARHGYAWEHNTLGLGKKVAPGFSPLELREEGVHVAGREYHVSDAVLPTSIVSAGVALFNTPMSLVLDSPDASTDVAKFSSRVLRSEDNGLTIENTSRRRSHDVTATVDIGVDGFLRVDMTILPKWPLRIDRLAIAASFPSQNATHYDRYLAYDFDRQRVNRHDLLDSVGLIERKQSFGFSPSIWIGRNGVGIEFIAETNAHHRLSDSTMAHHLQRDGRAVKLVNTLIDERIVFEDAYSFSFALLATPVIRHDSHRRATLLTSRNVRTDLSGTFDEFYIGHWRRDAMPLPGLPTPAPAGSADRRRHDTIRKQLEKANIPYLPYSALHLMPSTLSELDAYRESWSAAPARRGSPLWTEKIGTKKPIQPVSLDSRSIQDFILHTHVHEIEEHGIDGIYFDVAAPNTLEETTERYLSSHTPLNKGAVIFYPAFAHREFLLRYWKATKSIDPDFLIVHHGNHFPRYVLALIDFAVFGEAAHEFFELSPMKPDVNRSSGRVELKYGRPENYVPAYLSLPPSVIPGNRSTRDSASHVLLPQVRKFNDSFLEKNEDLYEHWSRGVLATWLLHDFRIWTTRLHGQTLARLLQSLSEFEDFDTAIHDGPRSVEDDVDFSSYTGDGETLQIYVNRSLQPVTIALQPLRGDLSPAAAGSARSIESTGGAISVKDNSSVTIPAEDFVAILVGEN